jgi:hypothetical protein
VERRKSKRVTRSLNKKENVMKRVMSAGVFGVAVALVGAGAIAIGQSAATGPSVKPAAVSKKAGTPPPSSAQTATSAGNNKAKVSTANSASDTDSFWIEKVDVDGDGDVEDTNLVWDDEDKVLFAYTVGAFGCRNGGTATAELLVATYAAGNARNRPPGSGFWIADLDKSECNAQAAAMWGCKFDASGSDTACGVATLDERNDDLVIVAASK